MGMYNEVRARCPNCGGRGYTQVRQYVEGFGNFDLDDPSSLSELSEAELFDLAAEIAEDGLRCERDPIAAVEAVVAGWRGEAGPSEGCGHRFNPVTGEGYRTATDDPLHRRLFPHA